jgi:hypothetical protein
VHHRIRPSDDSTSIIRYALTFAITLLRYIFGENPQSGVDVQADTLYHHNTHLGLGGNYTRPRPHRIDAVRPTKYRGAIMVAKKRPPTASASKPTQISVWILSHEAGHITATPCVLQTYATQAVEIDTLQADCPGDSCVMLVATSIDRKIISIELASKYVGPVPTSIVNEPGVFQAIAATLAEFRMGRSGVRLRINSRGECLVEVSE